MFSNKNIDDDLVMKPVPSSLLTQIVFNECEGCSNKELLVVLATIKNRVSHKDFPSTLDSVLLQPNQFCLKSRKPYTASFKKRVDTLFNLPITTPYLYFIHWKTAKKGSWMFKKERNWVKIGQMHYSI
jgi:hypothetical protein